MKEIDEWKYKYEQLDLIITSYKGLKNFKLLK